MYNIHNGYKAFENTLSYQEEARENDENCFRKIYIIIPHFNRDNFFFCYCFAYYNGLQFFCKIYDCIFNHMCVYVTLLRHTFNS